MKTSIKNLTLLTPICLSVLVLSGCVTGGKNTLPQGGDMTMTEIYKGSTGLAVSEKDGQQENYSMQDVRAKVGQLQQSDYEGYTRTSTNEINNLFKPLDNPQISMYVYPTLMQTTDGHQYPMPGFSTGVFLFSSNYYAMPSEHY